jgi:hypothetical protein
MPDNKPKPDDQPAKETVGGPSSSASGQIIAGKAYPPSGPPPPKAKAKATPQKQESPLIGVDSPVDPIKFISKGIYGAMDAVTNVFNPSTPSPSRAWGSNAYQAPTPPSWNTQMALYREQQQQMKEKQERLSSQKSASSASMAQQHLQEVAQQQTLTPPRKTKSKQQTPVSQ